MTDLFWPGDNRAGDLMSESAFLAAMVEVENSWLGALVDAGVAPVESCADLTSLVSIGDVEAIAANQIGGSPDDAHVEREHRGPRRIVELTDE